MALVRISRKLISDIESTITDMASSTHKATIAHLHPIKEGRATISDNELASVCETLMWGEYADLKDRLPDKWCGTPERIDVHLIYESQQLPMFSVTKKSGKLKVSPASKGSYAPDLRITLTENSHHYFKEYALSFGAYAAANALHVEKYKTLRNQVVGFLNSCKSLNDAVKKFPDIKLYLSDYYKNELDRVVERTPRAVREKQEVEEAVSAIDTNMITSMGVLRALQAA